MLATIIITNHNYGKYMGACIRSCLNQTLHSDLYEVIVVDDCSKDHSLKVINEYLGNYANLKLIKNKKNIGVAASSNKAIKQAKGRYVMRVDADDYINIETLRILTYFLSKNPEYFSNVSPTQRVGNKPLSNFQSIDHRLPMLSLANAMNQDGLTEFNSQMSKLLNKNNIQFIGEPKLDGLAVELVYENGNFVYGSTRGDGFTGENITENLKTIKAIPLSIKNKIIPELFEVRGEVFINHSDFKKLNAIQKEQKKPLFANPRN